MLQERRQTARILDEQRGFAQQFVRAALARFSSGTGGQADVLRAEIEVARLNGALRSIAAEVRAAQAMLNTSLARPADASIPAIDSPASAVAPPSPQTVRETALARRPELRAGHAEINRAQAEVSVMRSMYSPMAMVRTGPAYTMTDGAGWMVMVGISIPIWQGRLNAGVAEAEAMVDMSRADLQAMQRMVEGEAAVSRELVIASRERVLALRDEVIPRARQAIDPTLAEYSSGQLPLVSVINAAQSLWSAQGELVSAEFSLGAAQARLRRATGKGGRR
jgi:outer membrane protein TolC